MSYQVKYIEGIGGVYGMKLGAAGITTTDGLLRHCGSRDGRERVSRKTGIAESLLHCWARRADLMRIVGVGAQYAELLEASGVVTVRDLAARRPELLATELAEVNTVRRLTRSVPPAASVRRWIEQAGEMEAVVTP